MYTVTKDRSKIVAKTRRGLNSKLDSLESQRELCRKSSNDYSQSAEMSSPKPVFHQVNGKQRSSNQRIPPEITPHHEEIIKYISDGWNKVYREYEINKQQAPENRGQLVTYYQEKAPDPVLPNFKPFDLEAWWGQRLYHNITQNT